MATTYIHHNHNSQTLDNDIALLKLHGQAELRDGVCLVCLPARGVSHAAGKRCTVTGYGYMGEGNGGLIIILCRIGTFINRFTAGPIPLRVREAELPIVSDTECIRKVNAVTEKIFILPASSFCAGGEEGNDACQVSAAGGYLLIRASNINKTKIYRETVAVHWYVKMMASTNWPVWYRGALDAVVSMCPAFTLRCPRSLAGSIKL